jgi:sigma-B regulation protein RsbU (phosphoserine phosphatase)
VTTRTLETLPADGRSASRARRLVEHAIAEAGLPDVVDEALLLVTELVTNAVVHAGTEVDLDIEAGPERLRVEVLDRSPGSLPLVHAAPSETREGGRGMFLLDALATEWGTRHFGSGKSVWFCLGPADLPGRPDRVARAASAAPRRDLEWLVGLPADLEQRLTPTHLIGELLHRLGEGLGLRQGWLFVQSVDDERRWELVAAYDASTTAPDADAVRRLSMAGQDAVLPGPDGALLLPLRSRTGVWGTLILSEAAELPAADVALARLVGDRLSLVLRDDRAQANQLRSRGALALLAEASEMFAGTLDVQLALTLAAQLVVPRFAAWSAVLTAYEHLPRLVAVAHADEARLATVRVAMSGSDGQALATRLVRDLVAHRPVLVPVDELPDGLVQGRSGDVLAVPLVARRRLLGLLLVGRPAGGSYAADDVSLLTDLARRAALAVENARLYEERNAIAQALQASLLPSSLPAADDVEFGARYAAAGEGNEVGGDFYDVFALGEGGGFGIAIGDVCGKGAEAAAITGMARDVLRLLTRDGTAPAAALQRLNDVLLELGERGRFCTTTLGTVQPHPDGLRVRLSSAGHPPPVLLTRTGEASFVGRSGTLLGVTPDVDVPDDELVLAPGDALVFYTDGVTERRSGTDMFGDDNLLACLRASAGGSADGLAGQLEQQVQRFGAGVTRDDLAVLVVRCKVPRVREAAGPAAPAVASV